MALQKALLSISRRTAGSTSQQSNYQTEPQNQSRTQLYVYFDQGKCRFCSILAIYLTTSKGSLASTSAPQEKNPVDNFPAGSSSSYINKCPHSQNIFHSFSKLLNSAKTLLLSSSAALAWFRVLSDWLVSICNNQP